MKGAAVAVLAAAAIVALLAGAVLLGDLISSLDPATCLTAC